MIKKHTIDFFCAGSGSLDTYLERDIVTIHTGMKITAVKYMHVDDILKVLNERKIDESAGPGTGNLWLKDIIIGK